jgi:hypothetical protein
MANKHESQIDTNKKLLYPELSYKIQGCVYNVANKYGKGLKEIIYQNALAEELRAAGLQFEEQGESLFIRLIQAENLVHTSGFYNRR